VLEATADLGRLHAQTKNCRDPAINHARQRLFQSINHCVCLYLGALAFSFPLL
jgi:hypothetical protein